MKNNKYYYKYLLCSSVYVSTSTDAFGSFRLIPLLMFISYLLFVIITNPKTFKQSVIDSKYVGIFVLMIVIGVARHNLPNFTLAMTIHRIISLIVFYLSTVHIIKSLTKNSESARILDVILLPFFVLAVLNIAFFSMGVTREVIVAKDASILMGMIGFDSFNRVNFYLVGGVNSYGALNGVCLVLSLMSMYFRIHTRKISWIYCVTFLSLAFLTDSRGSLIFALFSVVIAIFYHFRRRFLFLKLLPYLVFLAPFIMFLLFPLLANLDSLSSFARSDNDLATGNSRFFIWAIIFNDLINNSGFTFFGNGDGGLYLTQSYKLIADLFSSYEDIVINSQNSIISVFLDFGFVALILLFVILFKGINYIKRRFEWNPKLLATFSASLIYILLIGVTEAIVGMYYQNGFVIFIYVFCIPFLIPQNKPKLTEYEKKYMEIN